MEKWINLFERLLNEHGYPVTVSVIFGIALYKIFKYWLSEIEENKQNMAGQIDRLAQENRAYRILFLRKMGLSEEELENIFPAYKLPSSEKEK